ncbi:MAG TPA: hypothetical protein PKD64_10970 [Pirellulaceae bacterium]|nr:hypothetical protein [Pirellulaceae bacterium]HMO92704.1 hypothetical protein [Pirellulaceae bacterium]HMP70375.1 hypothetical protein [Pirellulaceae bacterium]
MGQTKFLFPDHHRFSARAIETVFMVGLDQIPWPCSVKLNDGVLTIERNTNDSGRLFLSVDIPKYGELLLSTATLPERQAPYDLAIELVRGTLNRLNSQLFLWCEGGLKVSDDLLSKNDGFRDQFAELIFQKDSADRLDRLFHLLDEIVDQIFELCKLFADFVIDLRIEHEGSIQSAIGFILNDRIQQYEANLPNWVNCISLSVNDVVINRASHEFDWDAIKANMSRYVGKTQVLAMGPMVDFSQRRPPNWLRNDETFELQRQTAANFARGFARHLLGKNQLAYVAAGLNGISQQSKSFSHQLQITVDMLEAVDSVRTDISTLVSFDQPWGERIAWSVGGTHAMHIADTLLRHGLHISSFGLEVNLDYWPHGSLARDPLHWVDLIDQWSQFGVPLVVILSAPMFESGYAGLSESVGIDSKGQNGSMDSQTLFKKSGIRRCMTHMQLYNYLESVIRVLISKPIVNGILWRQWRDEPEQRFIACGLVDQNGELKSLGRLMEQIGTVIHKKRVM